MPQTRKYEGNAQRRAAYRRRRTQSRSAQRSDPLPSPVLAVVLTGTMSEEKRWRTQLREAYQAIAITCQEMEARYEQRTERWQESERGEEFQERIDAVHEALMALEELVETDVRQPKRSGSV